MNRNIDQKVEAKLLVESRNTCCVCWRSQEVQIHHILPISEGGDNSEDNLIVLCLNCHSQVHTKKSMAKNYTQETLRLYKTTWIDLIKQYPFKDDIINERNEIDIIRQILCNGDRRALYFPYHMEVPYNMFQSFSDFRIFIQKSGYRLLKNETAKESIRQIYKTLTEIEYLFPSDERHFDTCLHGMLGKQGLYYLDIKRQTIIFHLNTLSRLIGYQDDFIDKNEYSKIGFEIIGKREIEMKCFGNFQGCQKCEICDFKEECIQESR
jgi:hypothetical protein